MHTFCERTIAMIETKMAKSQPSWKRPALTVNNLHGDMWGMSAVNFAKIRILVSEISCLQCMITTDRQTDRHDRIHDQPPPYAWQWSRLFPIHIYHGIVHKVQRKFRTLLTPIKSYERPSKPFCTNISCSKNLDTDITQAFKLRIKLA